VFVTGEGGVVRNDTQQVSEAGEETG